MKLRNQDGFAMIFGIILVVIVIGAMSFAGWKIWSSEKQKDGTGISSTKETTSREDVPPKLKNIGFNLDYYDPATNRAPEEVK